MSSSQPERLATYVAQNAASVITYVESFPDTQRAARYSFIWRQLAKDRDVAVVKAARGAIAPAVVANLQNGRNVKLYRDFVQQCFEAGFDGVTLDAEWAAAKERQNSADLEKMQVALGQAQNALAKDSIRTSLASLARMYADMGDTSAAMKHVSRSRETCTTAEHTAGYCLQAFEIAAFAEAGSALAMSSAFVQRLEQVSDQLSVVDFARYKVASGLLLLERRSYRQAAMAFTNLRRPAPPPKAGQSAAPVTTLDFAAVLESFMRVPDFAQTVAVLVLAHFSRDELDRVLGNPDFKVLYESEAELRGAVTAFFECKYHQSLTALQTLGPKMRMDLFLSGVQASLVQTVRAKAIRQYVSPFVTVDLAKMAETFRTTVQDLEAEVAVMIKKKEIDARIDKTRGALQATHADSRDQTALRAATMAQSFVEDTEMALRTLSMHRNGVHVAAAALPIAGPGEARGAHAMAAAAAGGGSSFM